MDRQQVLQGSRSKSWVGNRGLALGRPGGAALWEGARGLTRRAEWATAWGSPTCTTSGRRGGGPAREHGRGHQGPRGDPSSFQDILRLSDVGASSHLLASDASPAS